MGGWPCMEIGSWRCRDSMIGMDSGAGSGVTIRRNAVSTRGTGRGVRGKLVTIGSSVTIVVLEALRRDRFGNLRALALIVVQVHRGDHVAITLAGLELAITERRRFNELGDAREGSVFKRAINVIALEVAFDVAIPGQVDGVDAGNRGQCRGHGRRGQD